MKSSLNLFKNRIKLESKFKSKLAIIDSVEWDVDSGPGSDCSGFKETIEKSKERDAKKDISSFSGSKNRKRQGSNSSLNINDFKEVEGKIFFFELTLRSIWG